ncbi:MAG: extracellular solute-binding protein [Clostridia bacterium]|nr:extracellular solute-binding protein [Clostridia bacterium]
MKKIISYFLCFCCFCACGMLAGCGKKDQSDTGKAKADITFLISQADEKDTWKELAKKYQDETGVKVTIDSVKNGTVDTLRERYSGENAPTLLEITSSSEYQGLREYFLDMKDSKIYSILYDKSLALGETGSVYAVPISVNGYGIVYNDEIAKKYFALSNRKSDLKSMDEVKSFQQLKTVAEDMNAHRKELGIDGVFASVGLAGEEDLRSASYLLNRPLYYEVQNSGTDARLAVLKTDKLSFRYGDQMKDLFDLYANNATADIKEAGKRSTADAIDEFARGKAVMMPGDSRTWEKIRKVSGNTVKADDVKMLPLYTGISGEEQQGLDVGVERYVVLNKKADEASQNSAMNFLEWLFSNETGKKYVTRLGLQTPFNTFEEGDLPDSPLVRDLAARLKRGEESVMMTIDRLFPDREYLQAVGTSLRDYAAGNGDWSTVKTTVTDRWSAAKD